MKLQAGPEDRGLRLDIFLARHLADLSRSQIQLLNRSGAIQIDGQPQKAGYRIRGCETVEIDLSAQAPTLLTAEQMALHIHFEDQDLAVIEKPAGVVVHPGSGTRSGTIVHGLLFHFRNLSSVAGEQRPGIVHRLDKKTSGLLIVAKNNVAHAVLSKAFHDRKVEKTYIALVHGKPRRTSGSIELPIGRHPRVRTRMAALTKTGRSAHTEYRILEEFRRFCLLEVKIKTGRTHQIRVHLSSIGHPVVGDEIYGGNKYTEFAKKYGQLNRYFLHSTQLRFIHPTTGKQLEFHSPLPMELQKLLERIKS